MRLVRPLTIALVSVGIAGGCVASKARQASTPGPSAESEAPDASVAAVDAAPPEFTIVGGLDSVASIGYGKRTRRDPNDLCENVEENLTRAEKSILTEDRSKAAPAASTPWDRTKPPKYLDIIDRRFALTSAEKAMLRRNGFVVPARLAARGFADGLHQIYESQLPIYVSSDAILHAIYKGNDVVMADVERTLVPRLGQTLGRMTATLAMAPYPTEVREDLALYLNVAQTLLAGEIEEGDPPPAVPAPPVLPAAKPFIESARKGNEGLKEVALFGRRRMIDFSQYTPRGHYADDPELQRWFRSSMWLSRLEFNVVSRKSRSSQPGFVPNPEETPREAVAAMALADLASRAGALPELEKIERTWTEFAGKREDVSIDDLNRLRASAGITTWDTAAADKLKAQIGNDFQRTARIHYMPQGSMPLPVIATMLGPRIVPDTAVETRLVHATVVDRPMPSFADVAFVLGNDRAKTYLASDLAKFPDLGAELTKGRAEMRSFPTTSLYTAWLGAIRDLQETPNGVVPSFTKTTAYADFKVNSTVAAYGQLRHNYVLLAGQAYDEGGCEIPDGYIEPNLALYESLVKYAHRGVATTRAIGASTEAIAYFERLEKTLGVLVRVVKDELAGRPLSDEEKRWLAMASEIIPPSSEGPGSNDGWYFNLFPQSGDAFSEHAFVADWFTSSNAAAVVYAGAREPRYGIFVVDVNGEPRAMVGPVARAFEHVGSLEGRLEDKDAKGIGQLKEPWAASYTVPALPFPPISIINVYDDSADYTTKQYIVRSSRGIGPITFEILDHHRVVMGKTTVNVGTAWTRVKLKKPNEDEYVSVVRLRAGEATYEVDDNYGYVSQAIGMKEMDYEEVDKLRQSFSKNH